MNSKADEMAIDMSSKGQKVENCSYVYFHEWILGAPCVVQISVIKGKLSIENHLKVFVNFITRQQRN